MFKIYHQEGTRILRVTHGSYYCWVSTFASGRQPKAVTEAVNYIPIIYGTQKIIDMSTLLTEVDTPQEAYEYLQMYLLLEN